MELYTTQQILERCSVDSCYDIMENFEIFDDENNKSTRMIIYNYYGWDYELFDKGFDDCSCCEIQHPMSTCSFIARDGNVDLLKYAHDNGCLWDRRTFLMILTKGKGLRSDPIICYREKKNHPLKIRNKRIEGKYMECLKYCYENGCIWDECNYDYMLEEGNLECFKYAYELGCPWNFIARDVVKIGGIEFVKFLHKANHHDEYWDDYMCKYSAKYGKIDCLKYSHEHGYPWNKETIIKAMTHEHLDCLVYAIKNGCPSE